VFLRGGDPYTVIGGMCGSVAQSENDPGADVDSEAAEERSRRRCGGVEGFKDKGKGWSPAPRRRERIHGSERSDVRARARLFRHGKGS
jgi:hypothetical protein